MKSPAEHLSPGLASRLWRGLARVTLVLVAGGSVWLLWWSFNRLLTEQTKSEQLNRTVQRLTQELDQMSADLSLQSATRVVERLEAEQEGLLIQESGLTNWVAGLQVKAVPLVLDVQHRLGNALPLDASHGLTVIPLTLELTPVAEVEAVGSPYQRILQFCHLLTSQGPRVDFVELNVRGESNSVQQATAVVHLWVGREETP
jgi:hypothetical protein